eukprot:COSAG01_NODE_3560_length_5928_cov_6.668209_11_plen_53_part_01
MVAAVATRWTTSPHHRIMSPKGGSCWARAGASSSASKARPRAAASSGALSRPC